MKSRVFLFDRGAWILSHPDYSIKIIKKLRSRILKRNESLSRRLKARKFFSILDRFKPFFKNSGSNWRKINRIKEGSPFDEQTGY